jgi:hypothetical protein
MDMAKALGPYAAELAQGSYIDDLRSSYKEVLTSDGIGFPTEEVEHAQKLWRALAAADVGEVYLNEDGSVVDAEGYTYQSLTPIMKQSADLRENTNKLEKFTRIALMSKAASLALEGTIRRLGDGHQDIETVQDMVDGYKQFIQHALLIEEWEAPWQEIVTNGFYGKGIETPLTSAGIYHGITLFNKPDYQPLIHEYFSGLPIIRFNMYQELSEIEWRNEASGESVSLAIWAGIYYRQAPDACNELLDRLVSCGYLPASVDWKPAVHHATLRTEHLF